MGWWNNSQILVNADSALSESWHIDNPIQRHRLKLVSMVKDKLLQTFLFGRIPAPPHINLQDKSCSTIYTYTWPSAPDSPSGVKWLAQCLQDSKRVQRSPLRRVHCGGITAQHFIISLLARSSERSQDTQRHTRGKRQETQPQTGGGGAYGGAKEELRLKWGWGLIMNLKGITQQRSHPHLWDKQKNKQIRQQTEEQKNKPHAFPRIPLSTVDQPTQAA